MFYNGHSPLNLAKTYRYEREITQWLCYSPLFSPLISCNAVEQKLREWEGSRWWWHCGPVEVVAQAGTVQRHGLLWPLIPETLIQSLLSVCVFMVFAVQQSFILQSRHTFSFPYNFWLLTLFLLLSNVSLENVTFFWSTWICYLLFIFLVPATVLDAFCACHLLHSLDLPSLRTENTQCRWLCLLFSQTWSIAFLVTNEMPVLEVYTYLLSSPRW